MVSPLSLKKFLGHKGKRLCNHRDGIIDDVCSKISVGVIYKAVEYIADTALFSSCHIKVETYESHLTRRPREALGNVVDDGLNLFQEKYNEPKKEIQRIKKNIKREPERKIQT